MVGLSLIVTILLNGPIAKAIYLCSQYTAETKQLATKCIFCKGRKLFTYTY